MSEIIYSKITNTPVSYKNRWNDATYKKEYLRWWRHEVKGLKRRPTKNVDGTLYKDTHPECQNMDYYKNAEIWTCEVCEVSMTEGMKRRHLTSKRHSNNITRKQILFEEEKKKKEMEEKLKVIKETPVSSLNNIILSAQQCPYVIDSSITSMKIK